MVRGSIPIAPATLFPFVDTLGGNAVSSYDTVSSSNLLIWGETPAFRASTVQRIRINVHAAGTFHVGPMIENGNGTVTISSVQTLTAISTGVNEFLVNRDFSPITIPVGGFLAIETDGTGTFNYSSSATGYQFGVLSAIPTISTPTVITAFGSGLLGYDYDLSSNNATPGLEHLSEMNSPLPSGWVSTCWNIANGVAVSTATGTTSNLLTSGNHFGIDNRTLTWNFQLTSVGSIVAFLTNPVEPSLNLGSMVRVNSVSNALEIMSGFSGTSTNYTGTPPLSHFCRKFQSRLRLSLTIPTL